MEALVKSMEVVFKCTLSPRPLCLLKILSQSQICQFEPGKWTLRTLPKSLDTSPGTLWNNPEISQKKLVDKMNSKIKLTKEKIVGPKV